MQNGESRETPQKNRPHRFQEAHAGFSGQSLRLGTSYCILIKLPNDGQRQRTQEEIVLTEVTEKTPGDRLSPSELLK